MALTGPKPKEDGQKRYRGASTHEWTDIPDVPFDGESPDLPEANWHPSTLSWWEVVRRMPHCALWADSDWLFALATALLADGFYRTGGSKDLAIELRQREKIMGTTVDARRDLRVRYVRPLAPVQPATVSQSKDPRARLRAVDGA